MSACRPSTRRSRRAPSRAGRGPRLRAQRPGARRGAARPRCRGRGRRRRSGGASSGRASSRCAARASRFFFGGSGAGVPRPAPDWLAVSPGRAAHAPAGRGRARARGIPVLAELEVAWRIAEGRREGANRWVAVTGTNGKSTTTAWIAEILAPRRSPRRARRQHRRAALRVPLGDVAPRLRLRALVLPARDRGRASADVAVLTNITPDHLDRHEGFEDYAAAKARVFAKQRPKDVAVVNADDPPSPRAIATAARRVLFSRRGQPVPGGAWVEGASSSRTSQAPRARSCRPRSWPCRARTTSRTRWRRCAAAECLGTPARADRATALREFAGLPHRRSSCSRRGGVRWVDDSKGTNVDATAQVARGLSGGHRHPDPRRARQARRLRGALAAARGAARARRADDRRGGRRDRARPPGASPIERAGTMETRRRARGRRSRGPATRSCSRPRARPSTSTGTSRSGARHFARARARRRARGAGSMARKLACDKILFVGVRRAVALRLRDDLQRVGRLRRADGGQPVPVPHQADRGARRWEARRVRGVPDGLPTVREAMGGLRRRTACAASSASARSFGLPSTPPAGGWRSG